MASYPIVNANGGMGQMPQANADWRSIISGLFNDYAEGQQYGQQRQVQGGRKATFANGMPDESTAWAQLMGLGDVQGANALSNWSQGQQMGQLRAAQMQKSGQPTFSLTPMYGVGPDGNPVIMQLGNNGSVKQVDMPPGVSVSNKPMTIDAGTHTVILDPITRQPIQTIPKNVQQTAAAREIGKGAGEAANALPGVQSMASKINQQIDDLLNDPYLPNMLGPVASRMPNISASAERVQSRMDQLQGDVFLQGYGMLRGGGAITEIEGTKAEAAIARLNKAQSEADYKAALNEFRSAVNQGVEKLQAQAARAGGTQPPAGAVNDLRQNPALRDQFDAKYGAGSAARILGGQ